MSLKLIYVNKVGKNFNDENMFEFLFSETTEHEWDDYWYESSVITDTTELKPSKEFVDMVGYISTKGLDLDLVQESFTFEIYNSVEGIIALAWEKRVFEDEDEDEYYDEDEYEKERVVFNFGEHKSEVEAKLITLGIELNYKKNEIKH